jgi:hypothetical protein
MAKDRTAEFIAQMDKGRGANVEAAEMPATTPAPLPPKPAPEASAVIHEAPRQRRSDVKPKSTRDGLRHFGGYLDDETLEKIALLRIRLKMDNSALIKHAIDELDRKHNARRAFGDA